MAVALWKNKPLENIWTFFFFYIYLGNTFDANEIWGIRF